MVGRLISDRMSYRNHYMCSGEATSILLRYPTPKFYFLMVPHATPVVIKMRGQDDIIFKCTHIFDLFEKISGNSGSHFYSLASPLISNLY